VLLLVFIGPNIDGEDQVLADSNDLEDRSVVTGIGQLTWELASSISTCPTTDAEESKKMPAQCTALHVSAI
jgi:hypothetical protein